MKNIFKKTQTFNKQNFNKQNKFKQHLHLSKLFNKSNKFHPTTIPVRKYHSTLTFNNISKKNIFTQRNYFYTNFVIPKNTNINNYNRRNFTQNINNNDFLKILNNSRNTIEYNTKQCMETIKETQKITNQFQQIINDDAYKYISPQTAESFKTILEQNNHNILVIDDGLLSINKRIKKAIDDLKNDENYLICQLHDGNKEVIPQLIKLFSKKHESGDKEALFKLVTLLIEQKNQKIQLNTKKDIKEDINEKKSYLIEDILYASMFISGMLLISVTYW